MRHFLSHRQSYHVGKERSGASRKLCLTLLVVCIALLSSSFAQLPVPTSRADNARDGANTHETLLTPANVNVSSFHRAFTFPVDYVVMAQPLYVPGVNIANVNHNVVYVATMADSVYAIDADTGVQLWYTNFTNPAEGIYTAQVATHTMPCGTGQGYYQEGIVGTPVIDTTNNTMYLDAKTVVNGTVEHHLHALDITTGLDKQTPVLIAATTISTSPLYPTQKTTVFNGLHQMNRPGLLLLNGVIYLGFGSNSCNDGNTGWVISYDEATLLQLNVFNTSAYHGLASIWQAGTGLAADEANNIFVETGESCVGCYDIQNGGQTYSDSVLKLSPELALADYFTPWYVAFLDANDEDLSSTGTLILPDQPGPYPHEVIASGKQAIVYVLNRDDMGQYSVGNDSRVIQEFPLVPGTIGDATTASIQFGSAAYWNSTVYFAPDDEPLMAFPMSGGLLGTPVTTPGKYVGSHSPSISANGNTNGIMWVISSPQLYAFDAVSLTKLYSSGQAAGGRDTLPAVGHFVTQTVANGRVYVGTRDSLVAYGLFDLIAFTAGSGQTGPVATTLAPINFQIADPYTGKPDVGVTVNFSDGCLKAGSVTCGSFNPASAVTDSNGNASTIYTLPQHAGTYTLTFSDPTKGSFGTATTTATATPDAPIKIVASSGNKQSGTEGSTLPNPIVVQAQDTYKNGISGVTVTFTATNGGVLSPTSVVTGVNGLASTTLQLPDTVATVKVTASSTGFKNVIFTESSVAADSVAITPVNGGTAPSGTE